MLLIATAKEIQIVNFNINPHIYLNQACQLRKTVEFLEIVSFTIPNNDQTALSPDQFVGTRFVNMDELLMFTITYGRAFPNRPQMSCAGRLGQAAPKHCPIAVKELDIRTVVLRLQFIRIGGPPSRGPLSQRPGPGAGHALSAD